MSNAVENLSGGQNNDNIERERDTDRDVHCTIEVSKANESISIPEKVRLYFEKWEKQARMDLEIQRMIRRKAKPKIKSE